MKNFEVVNRSKRDRLLAQSTAEAQADTVRADLRERMVTKLGGLLEIAHDERSTGLVVVKYVGADYGDLRITLANQQAAEYGHRPFKLQAQRMQGDAIDPTGGWHKDASEAEKAFAIKKAKDAAAVRLKLAEYCDESGGDGLVIIEGYDWDERQEDGGDPMVSKLLHEGIDSSEFPSVLTIGKGGFENIRAHVDYDRDAQPLFTRRMGVISAASGGTVIGDLTENMNAPKLPMLKDGMTFAEAESMIVPTYKPDFFASQVEIA